MEVSGITSGMSFLFPHKENSMQIHGGTSDKVDVHSPQILSDEEAETVYNDTISMIAQDPTAALGVHSGLSESRVFALVGM